MGAKSRKFVKKNVTLKNRMDKKSSPMRVDKVDKRVLGPVLMGFFIMGFCDIVAPISGRIATEFPASQQAAVSFLPTMVFLWFLVLSTPLAALMNRIGRKAMSMIGYAFTIAGLLVPFLAGEGCALGWYFAGFGLLGIGNTALQVAVNPLLATIVPGERKHATPSVHNRTALFLSSRKQSDIPAACPLRSGSATIRRSRWRSTPCWRPSCRASG